MQKKIAIIGAGSFGTALAQELSRDSKNSVTLFLRDSNLKDKINKKHTNDRYFKDKFLNLSITAETNFKKLIDYKIIFIAVPSSVIYEHSSRFIQYVHPEALLINLAKGLLNGGKTVVDFFKSELKFKNIVSLKGPSFSAEVFNNESTILTLGFSNYQQLNIVKSILKNTNLYIDFTNDIKGVEFLSAIKNIYAIYIGNTDAQFNSQNTRFLVLTKCMREIRILMKYLNCKEETLLLSCGVGDVFLTALNDLSVNRTLGLLVGKGFYGKDIEFENKVSEALKTMRFLNDTLNEKLLKSLPVLQSLIRFFITKESETLSVDFKKLLKNKFKTVLTYGTFDLLHYGHLEILRRAKDFGDRLIVGLSTDEFNLQKGKKCEFSYEKRKEYLESLEYVDMVIPETRWEQKTDDVRKYNVNSFVMGDDWKGKFDFLEEYCEVIYLDRTKGISTTALKSIIKDQS